MRFVDTNVLLYAVSTVPEEAEKKRLANELLDTEDLVLSAQVLQEFYAQLTRPSRPRALTHDQAVEFIRFLGEFHVEPITRELVYNALTFRQRFDISYWDAAILAAAQITGCDVVYSEDLSHTQDYGGVHVQNPFAPGQAIEGSEMER